MSILKHELTNTAGKRENKEEQSSPSSLNKNATEPLLKALKILRIQSVKVDQDSERANASLHNHLANAYLWWRKARELDGFIETEYDKLGLRKSSGQADPNFIPVLRVVCGKESVLKDQEFQRRSRALNAIHIEFESKPNKYKSDSIAKLVNFIKSKGGVSELAGYGHVGNVPADRHEVATGTARYAKAEEASRAAIIEAAVNVGTFDANSAYLVGDCIPEYVSTDDRDCFLLLVQQTSDGRRVIGRTSDCELIETVLVDNHRKSFEAHASIARPLLELLQTQCYPDDLDNVAKKLVDVNVLEGFGRKKFKSHRRVMFLHDSQQFLLSPINAYAGVVSLVTPNQQVLGKCSQDLFMPVDQSDALERKLLQHREFNLYDVGQVEQFPAGDSDTAVSHALTLVHRVDPENKIDLHFSAFYDSLQQPLDQVGLNPDYRFKSQWQTALPHCYFQKLADQFLDPWLDGRGKHFSRGYNSLVQVHFGKECLDISFSYKNGIFECQEAVEYMQKRRPIKSFSSNFLSKDWLLAFRSIALLPVDGDVSLAVNNDVLRIGFTTRQDGGAKHEIHIPTVDLKGKRSTAPFVRYEPELVNDDSAADVNPEIAVLTRRDARIIEGEVLR